MGNNTPNSLPPNMSERPSDDNRELYPSQPDKTEYGSRGWKLPGTTAVSSTVETVFEKNAKPEQLGFVFEDPVPVTETPVVVTPKNTYPQDAAIPMPEYIKNLVGLPLNKSGAPNSTDRSNAAAQRQREIDTAYIKGRSRGN